MNILEGWKLFPFKVIRVGTKIEFTKTAMVPIIKNIFLFVY